MAGNVGPLRLSVKPKTRKARKQPAVRRKIVALEGFVCMMGEYHRSGYFMETRPVFIVTTSVVFV
jgi:hypothetical protein